MIVSGATLKTVLKRDNIIEGGIQDALCVTIHNFEVEKCTKPGLLKVSPKAEILASRYGMVVDIHPLLLSSCEVSGAQFIPPDRLELPVLYVRPAEKDFDIGSLPYIYRLFVVDGRVKK